MIRTLLRSPWRLELIGRFYLSDELIDENLLLSVVPRVLTAVMIARAMPAAISAYSIAVAPDSFFKKVMMVFILL